ncbi:MAG: alpha/beta hydrolase [Catenulispora sp.]|nr:alpha/beta hydrolase [Catenulispora sp.]
MLPWAADLEESAAEVEALPDAFWVAPAEPAAVHDLADAQLAEFIDAVRRDPGPSPRELGAIEVRRGQRARVQAAPRGPEVGSVRDLLVGPSDVPVRVYRPAREARGTVVFLHGGMFVIGDLESHDRACRRLAHAVGVAVVAVDYRRAPEHPWPAAVDDAAEVLRWALKDGHDTEHDADADADPDSDSDSDSDADLNPDASLNLPAPVAVMGDSAGGALATLACLRLRDEGGALPALQVLAYPNTDLTLSQPSVRSKATGWGLDADAVAWGVEQWVPDAARRADPAVSPLYADLRGLPPALVVTAEHDPLRDEGDAYAAKLTDAGVPVRHRCETGHIHGFLTLDALSSAAAAAGDRLFADVAELL